MSSEQPMTGTPDHPIEQIPRDPSTARDWLVMLGGPTIWITHFMVVYLVAEAACVPTASDQYRIFGGSIVAVTVVATVVAAAGCAGLAWVARLRRRHPDRRGGTGYQSDMAGAGFLLALGGLIGVLAVGAPAAYLSPLC